MITRRAFLETVAVAAASPVLRMQTAADEWGSPVFDLHFHLRPQPADQPGAPRRRGNHQSQPADASGRPRSGQSRPGGGAGTVHVVQQRRRHEARGRGGADRRPSRTARGDSAR